MHFKWILVFFTLIGMTGGGWVRLISLFSAGWLLHGLRDLRLLRDRLYGDDRVAAEQLCPVGVFRQQDPVTGSRVSGEETVQRIWPHLHWRWGGEIIRVSFIDIIPAECSKENKNYSIFDTPGSDRFHFGSRQDSLPDSMSLEWDPQGIPGID